MYVHVHAQLVLHVEARAAHVTDVPLAVLVHQHVPLQLTSADQPLAANPTLVRAVTCRNISPCLET